MDVQIPCICPPKDGQPRHEHDTVTLPDVLDFRRTLTVRQAIRIAIAISREEGERLTMAELTATMCESYLLHCIDAWTCQQDGDKGKPEPIPVTKANVRAYLLEGNYDAAEEVGNAADDLYSEKVVLPLLGTARSSSSSTPTPPPTSQTTTGSKPKAPKTLSKPSSTTTTPMAATAPTGWSPAGVSSS